MAKRNMPFNEKREEIIKAAYKLFIRKGLEKTSIRNIANYAGINVNSIYYHFKTKAEIVICCVEFGLKQVSHDLFELALATNFYDEDSIKQFTEKLFEQKEELCWCYQVIASPNYNWLVKDIVINVRGQYKQYADKFEKKYGAATLDVKTLMGFAMLAVKEFIITEDRHCLQQFRIIIEKVKK